MNNNIILVVRCSVYASRPYLTVYNGTRVPRPGPYLILGPLLLVTPYFSPPNILNSSQGWPMRTVSVHNLTQDTVNCTLDGSHLVVLSSRSITATISGRQSTLGFIFAGNKDLVKKGSYPGVQIVLKPGLGRSCRIVKAPAHSPWQIYCTRVSSRLLYTAPME
jgi:hypothetical protein